VLCAQWLSFFLAPGAAGPPRCGPPPGRSGRLWRMLGGPAAGARLCREM